MDNLWITCEYLVYNQSTGKFETIRVESGQGGDKHIIRPLSDKTNTETLEILEEFLQFYHRLNPHDPF